MTTVVIPTMVVVPLLVGGLISSAAAYWFGYRNGWNRARAFEEARDKALAVRGWQRSGRLGLMLPPPPAPRARRPARRPQPPAEKIP